MLGLKIMKTKILVAVVAVLAYCILSLLLILNIHHKDIRHREFDNAFIKLENEIKAIKEEIKTKPKVNECICEPVK